MGISFEKSEISLEVIILSQNEFTYHNELIKQIFQRIKLYYYLYFSKIIYDIKQYIVTTTNFFKKL